MNIVLMIHSLWRWVVVIVALIALVKFGIGWLRHNKPDDLDRRLTSFFTIAIDIQVLLGILLLALQAMNGVLLRVGIEHSVVMIVAAVIAHLTAIWRKRDDNTVLRNNFFDVLAVLILIALGVARVGGWSF